MKKPILRARFGDIIADFVVPSRSSNKVIIFAMGMPSVPFNKHRLLRFLSSKGYWAVMPRYRGTWESGGSFLKVSPDKDVLAVMNGVSKKFRDLWSWKEYSIKKPEFYLIGSSFGGPAVMLNSKDKRVKKVLGKAAVVDWGMDSKDEPLPKVAVYVKRAFGEAFRFSMSDWKKLGKGEFYNPSKQIKKIDGKKIFLVHAKDDRSVPIKSVIPFAKKTGAQLLILKKGGHLSASLIMKPAMWKKINKFFILPT